MQKKSISKRSYYLLNALFHSLCLAGLLWQVTKVSLDFFSYEVMKDINIIMPEEVKKGKTVVFICTSIKRDILDMKQYKKIRATKDFKRRYKESKAFKDYRRKKEEPLPSEVVKKNFSVEERMAIFPKVVLDRWKRTKFFIGDRNCFQVEGIFFQMNKSDIGSFFFHMKSWMIRTIKLAQRQPSINTRVT